MKFNPTRLFRRDSERSNFTPFITAKGEGGAESCTSTIQSAGQGDCHYSVSPATTDNYTDWFGYHQAERRHMAYSVGRTASKSVSPLCDRRIIECRRFNTGNVQQSPVVGGSAPQQSSIARSLICRPRAPTPPIPDVAGGSYAWNAHANFHTPTTTFPVKAPQTTGLRDHGGPYSRYNPLFDESRRQCVSSTVLSTASPPDSIVYSNARTDGSYEFFDNSGEDVYYRYGPAAADDGNNIDRKEQHPLAMKSKSSQSRKVKCGTLTGCSLARANHSPIVLNATPSTSYESSEAVGHHSKTPSNPPRANVPNYDGSVVLYSCSQPPISNMSHSRAMAPCNDDAYGGRMLEVDLALRKSATMHEISQHHHQSMTEPIVALAKQVASKEVEIDRLKTQLRRRSSREENEWAKYDQEVASLRRELQHAREQAARYKHKYRQCDEELCAVKEKLTEQSVAASELEKRIDELISDKSKLDEELAIMRVELQQSSENRLNEREEETRSFESEIERLREEIRILKIPTSVANDRWRDGDDESTDGEEKSVMKPGRRAAVASKFNKQARHKLQMPSKSTSSTPDSALAPSFASSATGVPLGHPQVSARSIAKVDSAVERCRRKADSLVRCTRRALSGQRPSAADLFGPDSEVELSDTECLENRAGEVNFENWLSERIGEIGTVGDKLDTIHENLLSIYGRVNNCMGESANACRLQ